MPGHEHLNQDGLPPPKEGGEETKTVYRINAEAMKTVRREKVRGGEDLHKKSQAFGSEHIKYIVQ